MGKILNSILVLLFLINSISSQTSPEFIDFTNKQTVIVNGHHYYRFAPYSASNNTAISSSYEYVPNMEDNPFFDKYTFVGSFVNLTTMYWNSTTYTNIFDKPINSSFYIPDRQAVFPQRNIVFIIPQGTTVNVQPGSVSKYLQLNAVVCYGTIVVNPNSFFRVVKLIMMPGSTFRFVDNLPAPGNFYPIIGTPEQNSYLYAGWYFEDIGLPNLPWDPLNTASIHCLGCTFFMDGTPSTGPYPIWYGAYSTQNNTVIKKTGTFVTGVDKFVSGSSYFTKIGYMNTTTDITSLSPGNVQVKYNSTTKLFTYGNATVNDFRGTGQVLSLPFTYSTKISIVPSENEVPHTLFRAYGNASITLIGVAFRNPVTKPTCSLDSTANSQYYPMTETSPGVYTITSTTVNFAMQPVSFIHVSKPFLLDHVFFDQDQFSTFNPLFNQTYHFRGILGIVRSYGKIVDSLFSTQVPGSFVNIPWGTEDVQFIRTAFRRSNQYDYTYTAITTESPFPYNNDFLTAVYTASPFVTFTDCVFEGEYTAGSVVLRPIQNRRNVTGYDVEDLIGSNAGLKQNNSLQYRVNAQWNIKETTRFNNCHFFLNSPFFAYGNNEPTLRHSVFNSEFLHPRMGRDRLRWEISNPLKNIEETFTNTEIYTSNSWPWAYNYYIGNLSVFTGTTKAWNFYNSQQVNGGPLTNYNFQTTFVDVQNVFSRSAIYSQKNYFRGFGNNQLNAVSLNHAFDDSIYTFGGPFNIFNYTSNYLTGGNLQFNYTFQAWKLYNDEREENCVSYVNGQQQESIPYTTPLSNWVNNKTGAIISSSVTLNPVEGAHEFKLNCIPTTNDLLGTVRGPVYYETVYVDLGATNFYLGVDLTPYIDPPKVALTNFGKNWTKCEWVPSVCQSTGFLVKVSEPTQILNGNTQVPVTDSIEKQMLTSYLTQLSDSKSVFVNFTLPQGNFRFYLYFYNPTSNGPLVPIENRYIVKFNDKIQSPYTRAGPTFQQYHKVGPFFVNSPVANSLIVLEVDGAGFPVQLSGVEVLSSLTTPYPIPVDYVPPPISTSTTAAVVASSTTTVAAAAASSTTAAAATVSSTTAAAATVSSTTSAAVAASSTTGGSNPTSTSSTTKGSTTKGSTTKGSTTKGSTSIKPIFAATTHHSGSDSLLANINHILIMISLLLSIYYNL